ncbi:hypothetical protein pb186bvf_011802 [Paramecium bursaria]
MGEVKQHITIESKPNSHRKPSRSQQKFLSSKEDDRPPQLRNAQRFFRKPKVINEPIRLQKNFASVIYVDEYIPQAQSIPEAIKQIDRKIKQYKKLMERQYQEQLQREQADIPQDEEERKKSYDFLTNPQLQQITNNDEELQTDLQQEQVQEGEQERAESLQNDYNKQADRREKQYHLQYTKLIDKRHNPGLYAKLKKKTPRLNITSKNKITKGGNVRMDPEEHKLRIYNRENVPIVPDLILPTFQVKKDYMAQNILAYLKEYTPLFRGIKNFEYPKCVKNILQEEVDAIQKY